MKMDKNVIGLLDGINSLGFCTSNVRIENAENGKSWRPRGKCKQINLKKKTRNLKENSAFVRHFSKKNINKISNQKKSQ